MIRLFRSSPGGRPSHEHVFAINDQSGEIIFSQSADHEHQVELVPDQMTGEVKVVIAPGEDGHGHIEYEELFAGIRKEKKEDEEEVVQRVYQLFKTAYELSEESLRDADESEKFYIGDQWNPEVRRSLENKGRTCLTINAIEKDINDLLGYNRKNRKDLRFFPVEGGDQRTADLANILTKVVLEKSNFPMHQDILFRDQVVAGFGAYNLYVDTKEDVRGEVKVEAYPWRQVVFGPHNYPDASDCEYVVKYSMNSMDRVKKLFPKKAEEITRGFDEHALGVSENMLPHLNVTTDQYDKALNSRSSNAIVGTMPMIDVATKDVMVLELQEKILQVVPMAYFVAYKEVVSLEGFKPKDVAKIKKMPGVTVLEPQTQRLRITKVCANTLLVDENPADVPVNDFFIVPAYGNKIGNRFYGKVKNNIDPQREVNKRVSQSIDIVDRTSNHGFIIDSSMFANEGQKQDFMDAVAQPGFVVEVAQIERPPVRVDASPFPVGVVNLLELAESRIKSNLNVNPTRNAGANTSASAIVQAEQAVLLGSEYLMENHNRAMRQMGKVLLHMIRRYYDPSRIYRIVSNQNQSNPQEVGGQPFEVYSQEEIEAFVSSEELEKLDVIIGEGNWTPTQRLATLTILTDLLGKGAPVPMDMLAHFLDMPEDLKKQLIQSIQMQQQQQAQAAAETGNSEIQKSLIGKGIFPPKVLEEQGISPEQMASLGMPMPQAPQQQMSQQMMPQQQAPAGTNAPI